MKINLRIKFTFLFWLPTCFIIYNCSYSQDSTNESKNKMIELYKRPYFQVLKSENILTDAAMMNFLAVYGDDEYQFLSIGNGFYHGKYKIDKCNLNGLFLTLIDSFATVKLISTVNAGKIKISVPEFHIDTLSVNYISLEDFHYIIRQRYKKFLKLVPIKYDNRGNALNSEIPPVENHFMIGQQDEATLRKIAESEK